MACSYGLLWVMTQWPSGPRVTVVVPSGPLEVEVDVLLVLPPLVTVDPPELDETEGPVAWVELVLPLIVVEDDTLPPPAVTELDRPDPVSLCALIPFSSRTVQVSPSLVVICLAETGTAASVTRLASSERVSRLMIVMVDAP
jgi:hypothetical protein